MLITSQESKTCMTSLGVHLLTVYNFPPRDVSSVYRLSTHAESLKVYLR